MAIKREQFRRICETQDVDVLMCFYRARILEDHLCKDRSPRILCADVEGLNTGILALPLRRSGFYFTGGDEYHGYQSTVNVDYGCWHV